MSPVKDLRALATFIIMYLSDRGVFPTQNAKPKINEKRQVVRISTHELDIMISDYVEFSWDGENTKIQVKVEEAWKTEVLDAVILLWERWKFGACNAKLEKLM